MVAQMLLKPSPARRAAAKLRAAIFG